MKWKIEELIQKIDDKEIYINLSFLNPNDDAFSPETIENSYIDEEEVQRTIVWPRENWSKLIYSVFKKYPIPNIILLENREGSKFKYSIIDGKQRIHTLYSYVKNNFEYTDKKDEFSDVKGKRFEEMSYERRKEILSYSVETTIVKGFTKSEHKEIFELLNTNSVPLNHQEIRHAVYHGKITSFLNGFNSTSNTSNTSEIITNLIVCGLFTKKQRLRRNIDEFIVNLLMMVKKKDITSGSKSVVELFYKKYDDQSEDILNQVYNKFINKLNDSISLLNEMIANGLDAKAKSKTTLYLLFYLGFIKNVDLRNENSFHYIDIINEIKAEKPDKYSSIYRYWISESSRRTLIEEFLEKLNLDN